jgi:hypothetical protein
LKSSRDFSRRRVAFILSSALVVVTAGSVISVRAELPSWMRNVDSATALEQALFRVMALPYGDVSFRRPPAETVPALSALLQQQPADAELYSLRALENEQLLDFERAEGDWKSYAEKSADKIAARLRLADFYQRRLRPRDEIAALSVVAAAASPESERFAPAAEQRSWRAFQRIFAIIHAQGFPKEISLAQYRAWLERYPREAQLYPQFLDYLIAQKEYAAAGALIAAYQKQFPGDPIFAIKAEALLQYRQGSVRQGLAVYEKDFQPLWDPELVKSYFMLLGETQSLRKFLDQAHAALAANPQDLNATARIFYYYQQQGKLDTAEQAIATLRSSKEKANLAWTPQELYVCGQLLEEIHAYPEAARYDFALYNSSGAADSQERALTRLTDLLLTAPEAPIHLGAGNLAMYKDIATLDRGPGYLNGIVSLLLNSESPQNSFAEEEQRAVPYFHRARAAELLALLDKNFPAAASRPDLHVKLLEFYASSGKYEALLAGGREFLSEFPKASQRVAVSLLMADADEHLGKTADEFAVYDAVLQELATAADKMPLGSHEIAAAERWQEINRLGNEADDNAAGQADSADGNDSQQKTLPAASSMAFRVNPGGQTTQSGTRSPEYSRVLERYLARLVQLQQLPRALGILRREIDRNPNDPGLYERLAVFLEQNKLGAEQEEVYRRAMARFPDHSWYHKLARYYLRYSRNAEFKRLSEETVRQFDGSALESYFRYVGYSTPQLYLELNEYAHERFPHNLYFVNNLLRAYQSPDTPNPAAREKLLGEHWFEDPQLCNEYFEHLSATRNLEMQLNSLRQAGSAVPQSAPTQAQWPELAAKNPAAGTFVAEAELWRSHFEQAAPVLRTLAAEYPADAELGRTASSVFRSLAYFDPANTNAAVKIEENLLSAAPGNTETLARIGDIYADRDLFARAAPYWERIPAAAPGLADGYLQAASIYWDYFDFPNALRIIETARKKLGDEQLYGYEAGAICEGQRDYSRAIHEYAGAALVANGDSPALNRLLNLARRPQYRDLADRATVPPEHPSQLSMAAINLRVSVLEVENRKAEVAEFLEGAVKNAQSIEQAAAIETLARQKSLEDVRQHALEKQAALATDPVTRLQLRYQLVQLYESRKEFASAQRNIETLYRENPTNVGVVRATVDFYWSAKLYPQAIAVLEQAAQSAYPALGRRYAFEAARKSTDAREFAKARRLLEPLLNDSPYDGEYLAALADTYAQAGDQQGLKQFYLSKIALFRDAPIPPDERKSRVAALRRGLIPALSKLQDYPGAVDQYIEIINSFPEDEALEFEAALCALRHQRQTQLLGFYAKTVKDSPRDFRWGMVLGRLETGVENFPAAIEAYGKSIAIRPDRSDLRIARATLAERLLRFDDAAADYEHVYELTYKDPKWMEKVAEVRARQCRNELAAAALKIALIDAGPERAENYFAVARRLEEWGILEQARTFAEHGVNLVADELLAAAQYHEGANTYVRIMTRLRKQHEAYDALQSAFRAASSALPVLKEQIAKEGIAAVSDRQWRERSLKLREETARTGLRNALAEMGSTAARYFTPEEKVQLAAYAQSLRTSMTTESLPSELIPLVQNAGLAEEEADIRFYILMNYSASSRTKYGQLGEFTELQRRRAKFAELGPQLEQIATRSEIHGRPGILISAADAYRDAGDSDNEFRVLESVSLGNLSQDRRKHLYALLLEKSPQELVHLAGFSGPLGEEAADYVVAKGSAALAHEVVAARSHQQPPVWQGAYTALVGLYFAEAAPAVNNAFLQILDDKTIGERLGKPVDRKRQLAGNIWSYYGSRYGEYLDELRPGSGEAFLPANVELSPGSTSGYAALADYYLEKDNTRAAIENYRYALELSPALAELHDRLALAYYQDGNVVEATAEWKLLFDALLKEVDSAHLPESFWADFARGAAHTQSHKLFAAVKPNVDAILRKYLRHNGNYRSAELLRSAYLASDDPAAATQWLLELSTTSRDADFILVELVDAEWIPLARRAPLYARILEAKENAVVQAVGRDRDLTVDDLRSWQVRRIRYQIAQKQFHQADELLVALEREAAAEPLRESEDAGPATLVSLELQIAARLSTLEEKIAAFRSAADTAPSVAVLRASAQQLLAAGDQSSARKILEYVFARELEDHHLLAENFLGLAEIRIGSGDMRGAVELLRRLVNVAGDPDQDMDSSAALLEKTGHFAEAVGFLAPLAKATPWNPDFRVRLAQAQLSAHQDMAAAQGSLAVIAASATNSYAVRVDAATDLAGTHNAANFGSAELQLLAANPKSIAAAAANQPFFYEARLQAARNSGNARQKLQILTQAVGESPVRDEARVPLFRAAVAERSDSFALAALEQLLPRERLDQILVTDSEAELETSGAAPENSSQTDSQADALPEAQSSEAPSNESSGVGDSTAVSVSRLSPGEQALLAQAIGAALLRLHRSAEALAYFQGAQSREKNLARRKLLTTQIREIKARLQLEQWNAARRPILHAELEQDRLVRPRVFAAAGPSENQTSALGVNR